MDHLITYPNDIIFSVLQEMSPIKRISTLFSLPEETRRKVIKMLYPSIKEEDVLEVFAYTLPEMSFSEAEYMLEGLPEEIIEDIFLSHPVQVLAFYRLNKEDLDFHKSGLYDLSFKVINRIDFKTRKIEGYTVLNSVTNPQEVHSYILSPSRGLFFDPDELYLQQYKKKGFFIVILIDNKTDSLIGYVHGYLNNGQKTASVNYTTIRESFRGQHLCGILWDEMFLLLREQGIDDIEVLNAGGEKAYWCYKNAGENLGYKYICEDKKKEEFCHLMRFVR